MTGGQGRYLYAIVLGGNLGLKGAGVGGGDVYTIVHDGIAAVVHACRAEPYGTDDREMAGQWVLAHAYVIDMATREFGTVLPFAFDVIIKGGGDEVREWLKKHHGDLSEELGRVRDRAEYSIQVFYDKAKLMDTAIENDPSLKAMKARLDEKKGGSGYLQRRSLELKAKDAAARMASEVSRSIAAQVGVHADSMRSDQGTRPAPEKYNGMACALSLSCLLHHDKVRLVGSLLDGLNSTDGFVVRFTGPWAPFSFVRLKGD